MMGIFVGQLRCTMCPCESFHSFSNGRGRLFLDSPRKHSSKVSWLKEQFSSFMIRTLRWKPIVWDIRWSQVAATHPKI